MEELRIESEIDIFTNKDGTAVYKTGLVDDPDRTHRLYENGAEFFGEIVQDSQNIKRIH